MDKNDDYVYLGKCDILSIKNKLSELDENLWDLNTIRQNVYEVHKNTKTINLLWSIDSLLNPLVKNKKTKEYYLFDIDNFLKKIKKLYINKYGNGEFKRVILVKLNAKSNIDIHVDFGESLKNSFRTHIPIVTNPKVIFFVNGIQKNMKEGEIWEINNRKPHMVKNESEHDRIHLILDFCKESFSLEYF